MLGLRKKAMLGIIKDKVVLAFGFMGAVIHFVICLYVQGTISEGSWKWFPVFVLDFPASMLTVMLSQPDTPPLLKFGIVGSLWWFFVCGGIAILLRKKKKS
jgi:hypothetical protein